MEVVSIQGLDGMTNRAGIQTVSELPRHEPNRTVLRLTIAP